MNLITAIKNSKKNMVIKKEIKMLDKKCSKGDSDSCYRLGAIYQFGKGVKMNCSTAVEYFQKGYGDETVNIKHWQEFGKDLTDFQKDNMFNQNQIQQKIDELFSGMNTIEDRGLMSAMISNSVYKLYQNVDGFREIDVIGVINDYIEDSDDQQEIQFLERVKKHFSYGLTKEMIDLMQHLHASDLPINNADTFRDEVMEYLLNHPKIGEK